MSNDGNCLDIHGKWGESLLLRSAMQSETLLLGRIIRKTSLNEYENVPFGDFSRFLRKPFHPLLSLIPFPIYLAILWQAGIDTT